VLLVIVIDDYRLCYVYWLYDVCCIEISVMLCVYCVGHTTSMCGRIECGVYDVWWLLEYEDGYCVLYEETDMVICEV